MKKVIALLLVTALSLAAAAGCGGSALDSAQVSEVQVSPAVDDIPASAPEEAPKPEARIVNVGVSIYKFDDNFMTLYRNEIERYFKELESDTVVYNVTILDAKGDQVVQTNQVDEFIEQGVDVMIINLVQSTSASTVTERVKAAGTPVVYINREPSEDDMKAWDRICYVGADARQSGTKQGEIICDLSDKGDIDGDGVVRYVMIMGDPECSGGQMHRTEFSIKALTDAGIVVDNLFQQRGDWEQSKGKELTASALAQFGATIDVVFCNNDGMAMGAIQAAKEAGCSVGDDIYLVGVDAIPEALDAILAGDMTGTVLNDHIGQAQAAVDAAVRYVSDEHNDTYIWIDYVKITAENVSKYMK